MKFATKAIHSSHDCDEHNRTLMPPIYQNSMFALHEIGEQAPCRYSRLSNPAHQILEDTITDLERGAAGFAFSGDMTGIGTVWRIFLRSGGTIVAVADIYGDAYGLLVGVYKEWGISVVFTDLGNPGRLDELLAAHNVKLAWLETPSNPLLRLVDIKTLAARTHATGVLVDIDNTFVVPYLQQPLEIGCGIVFYSATKCLCDRSDILMDIVAVKTKELAKPLHDMMVHTDAITGPIDCWLVSRGIKTFTLCMEAYYKSALDIVHRFETHPAAERVFYPGLPSHRHYELAKTQMPKGIDGVVAVYLKNDAHEAVNSVIKNMKLVKIASSLGDVESLVNHYYSQSHSDVPHDVKTEVSIEVGLLRFFTDIEEADDIWNDISKASDSTL